MGWILGSTKEKVGKMVGGYFVCVNERGTSASWKGSLVCNGGKQREKEKERNGKGKANIR